MNKIDIAAAAVLCVVLGCHIDDCADAATKDAFRNKTMFYDIKQEGDYIIIKSEEEDHPEMTVNWKIKMGEEQESKDGFGRDLKFSLKLDGGKLVETTTYTDGKMFTATRSISGDTMTTITKTDGNPSPMVLKLKKY